LELFTIVDDAEAIIRQGVIFKQTKVYHRKGQLFVPHSGGYVRIVPQLFDSSFGTGHPSIKVVEIEGPGIEIKGSTLTFRPAVA
jgi:hypothetical protein